MNAADQQINKAKAALARSQGDMGKRQQVAREILIRATLMQKRVRRELPKLAAAAEAQPAGEAPPEARRAYLAAQQAMARCEQSRTLARQQMNQIATMSPALHKKRMGAWAD